MTIAELCANASASLTATLRAPGLWESTRRTELETWRDGIARLLAEVATGISSTESNLSAYVRSNSSLKPILREREQTFRLALNDAYDELPNDFARLIPWLDDIAGERAA